MSVQLKNNTAVLANNHINSSMTRPSPSFKYISKPNQCQSTISDTRRKDDKMAAGSKFEIFKDEERKGCQSVTIKEGTLATQAHEWRRSLNCLIVSATWRRSSA
ncbi:hypothetical protein EVAR_86586_1 [Eumeta japonica]|uniref:Uncharacterized protein n=1 Tax=Eumeta variegata TaxID=151549 RepID=A0A4C1W124_EUMVA|nr:hypothetical protein EVAR_86586_1 [Eumeta japonica]